MQRYFLSKLGQSILLLLGVMTLVFFIVRITGDPASLMASREASPETIEKIRQEWGFDRPLLVQFWNFVTGAVTLDFGRSYHFKTEAMPLVLERLPATVQLAAVGLLIAVAIGIPLGLVGGFNPGSVADSVGRALALLAQSIPNFWLALILILLFAVRLGWFPSFGRDELKSVVLPAFVLGTLSFAALGFLLGAVLPTTRAAQGIGLILFFVMLILGGVGPPREVMTEAMQFIGDITPLRYVVLLLQDPWLGFGWNQNASLTVGGVLLGSSLLSVWLFRWQ